MVEPLALPVLNRLLRTNGWALDALRAHAGKTLLVDCPPFALRLTISPTGELEPAARDAVPATTLTITPALLLRLAAREESASLEVAASGDLELARTVDHVRRHLEWDYEEDLSRLFGDVAAHRIAEGIRGFDRWGRNAALDLGRAFAEYAAHEAPLVASAEGLHEFAREVDEVRAAVDRLESRVGALTTPNAPSSKPEKP